MKTLEQIKNETINYLNTATKHTFIKPKSTFKYGGTSGTGHTQPGYYEYDYDNYTYFKIIKKDNDFYILENNKLTKLEVDWYFKYYEKNAKCVIKHMLFLGKKVKGIKNSKVVSAQINQILELK